MKNTETLQEKLMLALVKGIISIETIIFFLKQYKIELLNECCKN
jgi:hypothetical protein